MLRTEVLEHVLLLPDIDRTSNNTVIWDLKVLVLVSVLI